MPQLEQINTFLAQIFWLFICFGLVYLFLSRFVVPKLGGVIELRENTIISDINSAEQFKNNAVRFNTEYEFKSTQSRSEAVGIISDSSKQANTLYDKQILEAEAELKKNIEASEKEINQAKDKAIEDLNKNLTSFVEEIVSKVSGVKPSKIIIEKIVSKLNS